MVAPGGSATALVLPEPEQAGHVWHRGRGEQVLLVDHGKRPLGKNGKYSYRLFSLGTGKEVYVEPTN